MHDSFKSKILKYVERQINDYENKHSDVYAIFDSWRTLQPHILKGMLKQRVQKKFKNFYNCISCIVLANFTV